MDDRRAALLLSALALVGAGVRFGLSPAGKPDPGDAPGDVRFTPVDTPPSGGLTQRAHAAARLSRPLAPGERVDLDHADVTEITRLPRVGPGLAERIVAWRTEHGPFGSLERLDSVPGVGPRLLDAVRSFVTFSGAIPPAP